MNERFGVERKSTFGNVTAGIYMSGKTDADLLRALIEAGMRAGIDNERVRSWRQQVMNMRSRAYRGDWGGWVSVPGALAADLGQGRSLGSVLSAPLPTGTQRMSVGLFAASDADAGLGRNRVRQMLTDLGRLGHLVHRAVVKGRATPDERVEKVDLVNDRLFKEVNIRIGPGLRLGTAERWGALQHTLQGWLDTREMPV